MSTCYFVHVTLANRLTYTVRLYVCVNVSVFACLKEWVVDWVKKTTDTHSEPPAHFLSFKTTFKQVCLRKGMKLLSQFSNIHLLHVMVIGHRISYQTFHFVTPLPINCLLLFVFHSSEMPLLVHVANHNTLISQNLPQFSYSTEYYCRHRNICTCDLSIS